MDLQLADRVVLVTGGSRGIVRAAAEVAAETGGFAVPLDLSDPASIRAAVDAGLDRWGRLDVLVSNAMDRCGLTLFPPTRFEDLPAAKWQPFLHANVGGPYAVARAVVPAMRAQGFGRIVMVSGTSGADGVPGAAPLTAAKSALHGLMRTLTMELGPAGILVNVVLPGTTLTEHIAATLPAEGRAVREQASPIRRLLTPKEVVPAIAFLGSPANTAVTGELVRVSGGL